MPDFEAIDKETVGDILEPYFGTRDPAVAYPGMIWRKRHNIPDKAEPISVPWSLPVEELPAPIPTAAEVFSLRNTEDDLTACRPMHGATVIKCNGYAIKWGGLRIADVSEFMGVLFSENRIHAKAINIGTGEHAIPSREYNNSDTQSVCDI